MTKEVKISADKVTREKLGLPDKTTSQDLPALQEKIKEQGRGFQARVENDTLVVKRVIRD